MAGNGLPLSAGESEGGDGIQFTDLIFTSSLSLG